MDINNGRKSNDNKENRSSPSKSNEDNKNGIDPNPNNKGKPRKVSSKRYNPRQKTVKMPIPDLQSDKGESFAGGIVELEPDMPDLVEANIPDAVHEARTVNGRQNNAQPAQVVYSNQVEVRPFLPLPEPIILIPVHPVYTGGSIEEFQRRWREWYYQMYFPPRYEQRKRHGQGVRGEIQQQSANDNQNAVSVVQTQKQPSNAGTQQQEQPVTAVEAQSQSENGHGSDNATAVDKAQSSKTNGDRKTSGASSEQKSGTPKDEQKNGKAKQKSVKFQDQQPPRKNIEKQTQKQKSTNVDDNKESETDAAKNKKSKKRAQKHRKGKKHVSRQENPAANESE